MNKKNPILLNVTFFPVCRQTDSGQVRDSFRIGVEFYCYFSLVFSTLLRYFFDPASEIVVSAVGHCPAWLRRPAARFEEIPKKYRKKGKAGQ